MSEESFTTLARADMVSNSSSSLLMSERGYQTVRTGFSQATSTWRPLGRRSTLGVDPHLQVEEKSRLSSALANPLLPILWAGDVVIAFSVTASVAPALTIVDKAIVEQSARSGERGVLLQSMKRMAASIISNPIGYFRSPTFGWMWLTYAATYTTANMMKTWNEQLPCRLDRSRPRTGSGGTLLVAGTTLVNSGASLVKDRAYARMFGQSLRPVPTAAYLSWMARDCVVIGSSFVLPSYVTPLIQDATGLSLATSATISQLFTPVVAQLVAGPLHLWGLTLYNAAADHSLYQKVNSWRNGLASVTGARMLRILPGYGVAGVINKKSRSWWKQRLLESQVRSGHEQMSRLVSLIRSSTSQRT